MEPKKIKKSFLLLSLQNILKWISMDLKKAVKALLFMMLMTCSVSAQEVVVGAAHVDEYVPILKGKKIGLFSNHTGMVGDRHTLDIMLENGLDVDVIYSPEHGFRGTADAGEHVKSSVDAKNGIRIESL